LVTGVQTCALPISDKPITRSLQHAVEPRALRMILALTGGTGGAKLIEGLAAELDLDELTIVCNTADDTMVHGLYVSPDLDTITYTLAGLIDPDQGWGLKNDTFGALQQL